MRLLFNAAKAQLSERTSVANERPRRESSSLNKFPSAHPGELNSLWMWRKLVRLIAVVCGRGLLIQSTFIVQRVQDINLKTGLSSAYTPRESYLRGLLKMSESRDHGRVQEVWPILCQCSRQMSSENVDNNNDNVVPGRTTLYSARVLFNDRRASSSGSDLQQQREPRRHPPSVDGARRSRLTSSSFDAEHSLSPLTRSTRLTSMSSKACIPQNLYREGAVTFCRLPRTTPIECSSQATRVLQRSQRSVTACKVWRRATGLLWSSSRQGLGVRMPMSTNGTSFASPRPTGDYPARSMLP